MPGIQVREGETIDEALNRFKKQCLKDGTIKEARRHSRFEKPSVKKKNKAEAARRRNR